MKLFIFLLLVFLLALFASLKFIYNTLRNKEYYIILQMFLIGVCLNIIILLYLTTIFKNKIIKSGSKGPRGPKGDKGDNGENDICNKCDTYRN